MKRFLAPLFAAGVLASCVSFDEILPPTDSYVAQLVASPWTAQIEVGEALALETTLLDEERRPISAAILFESTDPEIATVSPEGVVTAVSPGSARIRVDADARRVWVSVLVLTPAASMRLVQATDSMMRGDQFQFKVEFLDEAGRRVEERLVDWRSSAPDVVQMIGGTALARSRGRATITGEALGFRVTQEVRVTRPAAPALEHVRLPWTTTPATDAEVEVPIHGRGFWEDTRVRLDGVDVNVERVGSERLRVALPAGRLTEPGEVRFEILNDLDDLTGIELVLRILPRPSFSITAGDPVEMSHEGPVYWDPVRERVVSGSGAWDPATGERVVTSTLGNDPAHFVLSADGSRAWTRRGVDVVMIDPADFSELESWVYPVAELHPVTWDPRTVFMHVRSQNSKWLWRAGEQPRGVSYAAAHAIGGVPGFFRIGRGSDGAFIFTRQTASGDPDLDFGSVGGGIWSRNFATLDDLLFGGGSNWNGNQAQVVDMVTGRSLPVDVPRPVDLAAPDAALGLFTLAGQAPGSFDPPTDIQVRHGLTRDLLATATVPLYRAERMIATGDGRVILQARSRFVVVDLGLSPPPP